MKKINWLEKVADPKFWVAIIGVTIALLVAFGVDEVTVEQVSAVIGALGVAVAFILGKSYEDGKREEGVKIGEIVADITADLTDKIVEELSKNNKQDDQH